MNLEIEKVRRVIEYFRQTSYSEDKIIQGRKDAVWFFKEYDRRRNQNLFNDFPELREVFLGWRKSYIPDEAPTVNRRFKIF